ncbi:hypothetical protein SUGI_1041610 [Cryptomeria japonica]|nr:hypothetical protein SUGI_1041610 [Cryptomeria japonica]
MINATVLQSPPSAVAEIIIDPFSKEDFDSILEHSKGGGRSKGFLSQPTILPEENIPSISNKPPHTMGLRVPADQDVVPNFRTPRKALLF